MILLNSKDDMDWLFETHLKNRPDRSRFKSAVLIGNEDCPKEVYLYKKVNPLVSDPSVKAILNYEAQKT